jgi:RimJ/RimL family protein N-acetyltransferase
MPVPAISAPRLDLVSMSPALIGALLDGRRDEAAAELDAEIPDDWPGAHDAGFLALRRDQMLREPERREWLVRALVLREPGRPMVGHAGFHGPRGVNGPERPDAVEVGYTVFPPFRGRGYATEAVVALIEWARGSRSIRAFVASVAPDNDPSLAIVRKLGFVQTGEQWDEEDGLELVFQLDAE